MTKSRKAGLLLVFVTVFIDLLGFGIVLPLLPRYGRHFDASGVQIGLLMASFSAMQFIFAPLWGRLSDRIGRRPVLIVGLLGSTVSYAMFGLATTLGRDGVMLGLNALTWLFMTRIGAGIAGATISTAQAYIADVTQPRERAKGMALIGAAFGIGFTFGPLLGAVFVPPHEMDALSREQRSVLEEYLDNGMEYEELTAQLGVTGALEPWQQSFLNELPLRASSSTEIRTLLNPAPSAAPGYVAAVLSGLALLLAILVLPESLNEASTSAGHRWLDLNRIHNAIRRPAIGSTLFAMFLTTVAFAQFESTLSLLTHDLGRSTRFNFLLFAYIGFVLTLSQGVLVRRLVPKLGEFRMSTIGAVLMMVGLGLIGVAAQTRSVALLYWVLPINVVGFSALTPSLQSLLSRRTAADEQGGILGLSQSVSALARILGPMLGPVLEERDIAWPYWCGAALMLLGVILVASLGRVPLEPDADPPATADVHS